MTVAGALACAVRGVEPTSRATATASDATTAAPYFAYFVIRVKVDSSRNLCVRVFQSFQICPCASLSPWTRDGHWRLVPPLERDATNHCRRPTPGPG